MLLRRIVDVLLRRPVRPFDERSTRSEELVELEHRVDRINDQAKRYVRLTEELDGAVASMRRRR